MKGGALLLLALFAASALAQPAGLVTMTVEPDTIRLVAGETRTVLVRIHNGASNGTYVETPTVEGLPNGVTLGALEGPGGSRPEGTPAGAWLLAPGETKEFNLIFNPTRGVVRGNTTVVLHTRISGDEPAPTASLQVIVLSVFGSSERAPVYTKVPPAAWAGIAGMAVFGGLVLGARSDAGRILRARVAPAAAATPEERARVLELVRAAPGIGFEELRRASGLSPASLVAVVEALAAEGSIRVDPVGLRREHRARA